MQNEISALAPAKTIWNTITDDKYDIEWLVSFGERNIAQTDWKEGSKAIFIDGFKTVLFMAGIYRKMYEQINEVSIIASSGKNGVIYAVAMKRSDLNSPS